MALGNTAFGTDGLIATTLQHYRKKLEDVIFGSNPLLYILKQAGIESQNGRTIVQPLMFAGTTTFSSYSDTDTFPTPLREGVTASEYPWKGYAQPIFFTGPEMAQNSGPEQAISLLKTRIQQAERTMSRELNIDLFLDGTGNGGKDFMGLAGVIANGNVYGGIDRADALNAWWDANVVAVGGALTLTNLRKNFNDNTEGNEAPTHILTTQEGFETYESFLEASIRTEDRKMGDAGFQNLLFKATPIAFDRACQDGVLYYLNTNHLKLVSLGGRWFDWSDWLIPVNQDAKYKNLILNGNLTSTNSKRLGKLTGLTNA